MDSATTGSITNVKALQKSSSTTTNRGHAKYMQKRPTYKFKNWENSNDPNQDKIVVELRKKLRLPEIRQEEMEAKPIELRKANSIAKQSMAEYQARKSN